MKALPKMAQKASSRAGVPDLQSVRHVANSEWLLTLIRNEAAKLDRGGLHATSWETRMALKTIKDECDHLSQFVSLLAERARHLVD